MHPQPEEALKSWTPPGSPRPRRRRRGWIIAGIAVGSLLLLYGVGEVALLTAGKPKKAPSAAASGSAAASHYTVPSNRCALVSQSELSSWAGTEFLPPRPDSIESGGPVNGCMYDVQRVSINTFDVYAIAGGDPRQQYDQSTQAQRFLNVSPKPLAGLGERAFIAIQQGPDKRQITEDLAFYDGNLFLELRFLGGGKTGWDPAAVQRHMVAIARDVLSKVPRT